MPAAVTEPAPRVRRRIRVLIRPLPRLQRRHGWVAAGGLLLVLVALTVLTHAMQAYALRGRGLRVVYRVGQGASAKTLVVSESVPSTPTLRREVGEDRFGAFRASWTGTLLIDRPGQHTVAVYADGVMALWLDGLEVLRAADGAQPTTRTVDLPLARGPHDIRVAYRHRRGPVALYVAIRPPGGFFRTLPWIDDRLLGAPVSTGEYWRGRIAGVLPLVTVGVWMAAALAGGVALWRAWIRRVLSRGGDSVRLPVALRAVLLLGFGLSIWGIEWGLPSYWAWAPDEVTPARLFTALGSGFIGGWHDLYPPLHFYLLGVLGAILEAGGAAGWYQTNALGPVTLLYVAMRSTTVLMALGCLLFVFLTAREVGTERHGVYATLLAMLSLPFLHCAKTVNVDVPYLLWVTASLWFYARFLRGGERRDALWLAATATAAVCTKDHAYGFYVLMPIPIVAATIARARARGEPAWRGVFDPTLARAAAVVLLLAALIYLVPVNLAGVVGHLDDLRRGTYPPIVERTIGGQLRFLWMNLSLLAWSAGWPAFLVCAAGLLLAMRPVAAALWPRTRNDAVGRGAGRSPAFGGLPMLLVPAVSYYVTFILVIQYTYDRFLLGVWLILAIFGGYFIDHAMARARAGVWKAALTAGLVVGFTYTLLYAATVDAAMGLDARYGAERFLKAHTPPFGTVYRVYGQAMQRYLPRVQAFRLLHFDPTNHRLGPERPDLIVLNDRERPRWSGTEAGGQFFERLEGGALGYRRVVAGRTALPFWALAADPRIPGLPENGRLDHFDKVNPPISIYVRDALPGPWQGAC